MDHYLCFSAFDNPMQLSKVGNWVITFAPTLENMPVQLTITNVIPRQMNTERQLRTLNILQTANELEWKILDLEFFDSSENKTFQADLESELTINFLTQLIKEFSRYDVEISLK